jgi:hypothetical protein
MIFMKKYIIEFRMLSILHYCLPVPFYICLTFRYFLLDQSMIVICSCWRIRGWLCNSHCCRVCSICCVRCYTIINWMWLWRIIVGGSRIWCCLNFVCYLSYIIVYNVLVLWVFFLRYTTTSNVSQYSNAIQYYSTTSWFPLSYIGDLLKVRFIQDFSL